MNKDEAPSRPSIRPNPAHGLQKKTLHFTPRFILYAITRQNSRAARLITLMVFTA
jgi:hypothetical protein